MADESATLGGAGDQIEVTWSLDETTSQPSGKTVWVLRIKICNKTNRRINGRLAENPWRGPDNTEKMNIDHDKDGKEVEGSDAKWAHDHGQDFDLKPGECTTKEFVYDVKPGMAYTDIYERDSKGNLPESGEWHWGTVHKLEPVKVAMVDPRQQRTICVAIPIPFQMSLDQVADGPVHVSFDSIEVPSGFELAHSWPEIGVAVPIERSERGSSGAVILRQIALLYEGSRHRLTVHQRITRPESVRKWPVRSVSIDLVCDSKPPAIRLASVSSDSRNITLEARFRDEASGPGAAELVLLGEAGVTSIKPSAVSAGDRGERVARFLLPRALFTLKPELVIRATDAVGNQGTLAVPKLSLEC